MADGAVLRAVLTAVDRMTPVLKTVQRSVKQVNSAVQDSGHAGNVLRERIGVPVSIMAAVTTASLAASVKAFGEYGGAVTDAADKTQVAVDRLQELHYAGKKAGVETGTVDAALVKLNKNLGDAGAGKNKEFLALLDRLGIKIRDASGKVRNAADVMPELADAIQKNENVSVRTRMAMAAFGKAGADLLPMLKGGSEGLNEMAEQGRRVGYVLGAETIKRADDLDNQIEDLGDSIVGMTRSVSSQLAPVLGPLLNRFAEWIQKNRQLIATKVETMVTRLATSLQKINWTAVGQGIERFWQGVEKAVSWMGGWDNALIAFVALANASVIAAVFEIVGAFWKLGAALLANDITLKAMSVSFGWLRVKAMGALVAMSIQAPIAATGMVVLGGAVKVAAGYLGSFAALATAAFIGWEIGKLINDKINEIVKETTGRGSLGELVYDKTHADTPSGPISLAEINKVRAQSGKRQMSQAELDWVRGGKKGANPAQAGAAAKPAGPALYGPNGKAQPTKADLKGELVVKIEGAPPGTKVDAGKTNQPGVKVKTDVGYRSGTAGIR